MKINIIGIGKVTTAFAYNLKGKVEMGFIVSRSREKAKVLAKEIGGIPVTYDDNFVLDDIVLVGYPDNLLSEIPQKLEKFLGSNVKVIHFSGFYPSTIFPENWSPASVHPNCPVIGRKTSFKDVIFGIEGNIEVAKKLISLVKGKYFVIDSSKKIYYHLAAVLMSNFNLSLIYLAEKLYKKANIPFKHFSEVVESLLKTLIKNVKENGTVNSITGPIVRNDIEVVNAEMEIFCEHFPEHCQLFDNFIQIILSMKEEKELESRDKNS
ncbi:DUF2520 domain-containing protein [Thermosipho ferrireducens]|uniref:DUF2520 domain-containing protein n=1 Tax=Thermosipho ferrireducens TaxID=2571116 RepID=A0ABX7S7Q5_9BACT|nr:DUF2520 domain-containing protein [Thermosipho ferrireducens]QTA37943.1 DUF2520 domain-containing protein [Thermosipho ferrireducens]